MYHILKILYFANAKSLAEWGVPLIHDQFLAYDWGPVPATIYDALKNIEHPNSELAEVLASSIRVLGDDAPYTYIALNSPNMKEISEAAATYLSAFIEENAHLPFRTLAEKSHGTAWQEGREAQGQRMQEVSIAREFGADDYTSEYLQQYLQYEEVGIW